MPSIENNESAEICGNCGGKCCKCYAGGFWPDEFGAELHARFAFDSRAFIDWMVTFILSGEVVVDWWEGDVIESPDGERDEVYFLRPRHKNEAPGSIRCPAWRGECIYLGEAGCVLSFEARPYACRALVPSEIGHCKGVDKRETAIDWRWFQTQVESAMHRAQKTMHEIRGFSGALEDF